MTIKGTDVSKWQSETYSLTGFDFVIVKATQGSGATGYVNEKHAAQVKRARDNGRVVGHYHHAEGTDISAQVDYFLTHAGAQSDEFLALDWENPDMSSAEKDAFLSELKAKAGGRKVLLYCNTDYWTTRDTSGHRADGLWIAQYGGSAGHPSITDPWLIQQYTDSPVDTNVANFASRSAMATWAGTKAAPKPPPKPAPKPAKPAVSLANVVDAAKRDPKAAQGKTTHAADVKLVEAALRAEKLLSAAYATDGSFGSATRIAYAKWQQRSGVGGPYDGIPGKASLTKLGSAHGFTVKV